jgi:hypothetical protein
MRSLTALGVSATAAAAYAKTLAPGAAAAGLGRDRAGLRVRGLQDYPTGEFGDLTEVVQLLLQILAVLQGVLSGGLANAKMAPLRLQTGEELDPDAVDQLDTLSSHLSAHSDALRTLLSDLGGDPSATTIPELSYDTIDDALFDLKSGLEANAGIYAGVIPQTTVTSALSAFAAIGLVEGRHAAFVSSLIGEPAFPETFQSAATPDQVDALLAGLGG